MKKFGIVLLALLLLNGCAAEETFETIGDELVQSAGTPARQVNLTLPEEAAVPVSESEAGQLYLGDGYEILVQTLSSGDIDATIRSVTGFGREEITLMQTGVGAVKRYELVWSCMGETGDRVGRAAILDDGSYHYVLSFLTDADRVRELEALCTGLFESYSLG